MHRFDVRQITIIGTGLLGGSIGLALRAAGYKGRIIGHARRAATTDTALKMGCIDAAATDLAASVEGSDFVVLCTPVGLIPQQLKLLHDSGRLAPGVVITDVGSTKRSIVAAGEAVGGGARFVGSHPMAGGSLAGCDFARADLFQHKPAIVTPTGLTDPEAVRLVERFWLRLGMHVHRMSVDQHDVTVARISHLPHAVAVLLVALAERQGGLEVASTGFADTTRVAGGDPQLWADIFLDNRDQLLRTFDDYAAAVEEFRRVVLSGDREELMKLLVHAQKARLEWRGPGANGNGAAKHEPT